MRLFSMTVLFGVIIGQVQAEPCFDMYRQSNFERAVEPGLIIPATEEVPEHCVVRGVVNRSIEFELRMPTTGWNGRFLMMGTGGSSGYIAPTDTELHRGFATSSTNTGHRGSDFEYAAQPEAALDYAFRAVHLAALTSKALIQAYYEDDIRYSYYQGCSNGGRQGMIEATRYPDDFDGIVAGAPVFQIAKEFLLWTTLVDRAQRANPLTKAHLALLDEASRGACDAMDGVEDGVINDPRECTTEHFDPTDLLCAAGQSGDDCLTDGQLETVKTHYRGVVDVDGTVLSPGLMPGAEGADACSVLNNICANNVDVRPGRLVYTQWLNEAGGIETDLTVTRLNETAFLIVTAAETEVRDFSWLMRHIPPEARCVPTNVTSGMAVISIMGPRSRELLQSLTPDDMSHTAFPFATSREIELGYAIVRASRITFVGELGWELYIPTEFATGVYDEIVAGGETFGLVHAGYHTLNSLRMEKGYRHWSHDITDQDTPLEAGLGFAVKLDKADGFIGRDALLKQKEKGLTRRLVQFKLKDPQPLLYHNEPIWQNEEIVGYIASSAYGHTLRGCIGLGYVNGAEGSDPKEQILAGGFEIEVAGVRFAAEASLRPIYDPGNERIRAA